MNIGKWIKVIGGLLLIAIGMYSYILWLPQLMDFIKGGLGIVLILVGLLAIAIGSVE